MADAYILAADRLGTKPKRFPKTIKHGRYIARLDPNLGEALWRVTRDGVPVGKLDDGIYGWGRPSFTINELRWNGDALPEAPHPNAYLFYDGGPAEGPESYQDALKRMAAHVERAIAWRGKQKDLVDRRDALLQIPVLQEPEHAPRVPAPEPDRQAQQDRGRPAPAREEGRGSVTDVEDKIRKLLALASHPSTPVDEARTAAHQAAKLMREHKVEVGVGAAPIFGPPSAPMPWAAVGTLIHTMIEALLRAQPPAPPPAPRPPPPDPMSRPEFWERWDKMQRAKKKRRRSTKARKSNPNRKKKR